MTRRRQEPRINLRFRDLELMDSIELFANQRGYNLQDWVRMLVMRELSEDFSNLLLIRNGINRLCITQNILEQIADDHVVKLAHHRASQVTEKISMKRGYNLWGG